MGLSSLSRVNGLLLAGGRSRRFGSDKRFASFGRVSMVERGLRKLVAAVPGSVFVAPGTNPETVPGAAAHTVIRDERPGAGPLAGIVPALRKSPQGLLVLACDVPNVAASTLESLLLLGLRYGRPVAPRGPRGWEPLVAYYPRGVLTALEAALRGGLLSAQPLLDRLGSIALLGTAAGRLSNVNRPADLLRALELEAKGGGARQKEI